MKKSFQNEQAVLVGVMKSPDDLRMLLKKHCYRIPVAHLPKRKFAYAAFYQPVAFGRRGKRLEYYGKVVGRKVMKRIDILPDEPEHPRAHDEYLLVTFAHIEKLARPIRNIVPRRVSFGFTTIEHLLAARDILELYNVSPTEQIMKRRLESLGLMVVPEHTVSAGGVRRRIDLAIFCREGKIAIECDNDKAHASAAQKKRDTEKDSFLGSNGWLVARFGEKEINEQADRCVGRIAKMVRMLGGQKL